MHTALQAITTFVDILHAASNESFQWLGEELVAAFEWASTIQKLHKNAATELSTLLQGTCSKLLSWLIDLSPVLARRPRVVLLATLLQRTTQQDVHWFRLVATIYIRTCVSCVPDGDDPSPEADLLRVLSYLGQQQELFEISRCIMEDYKVSCKSMYSFLFSSCEPCDKAALRYTSLEYFTKPSTLALAAAAQLYWQSARRSQSDLSELFPTPLDSQDIELLSITVLVPIWEQVIQRIRGETGVNCAKVPYLADNNVLAIRQNMLQILQLQITSNPEGVLKVPSPVWVEVCRESFSCTCMLVQLALNSTKSEGDRVLKESIIQHLLLHDDIVSQYVVIKRNCQEKSPI